MSTLTIRLGGGADRAELRRLAERDCAEPLGGRVLLAERDGRLVAAISLDSHRAVADPFLPTAETVEMLVARARQLVAADPRRQRRLGWPLPQRRTAPGA